MLKLGKIIRMVPRIGVGYLLEEGEGGLPYAFNFSSIHEYSGDSEKELERKGFWKGSIVLFELEDQKVKYLRTPIFRQ